MTRVTFVVSSSPFAANMCDKQNEIDHALGCPSTAVAAHNPFHKSPVHKFFYVNDDLTSTDSLGEATKLEEQL